MAVLEALQPMVHQEAGQTIVRDIRIDVREDSSGEDAVYIMLILGDPHTGQESWPVEDLRFLREAVRERLAVLLEEHAFAMPWYLMFEPEHPDLADDQLALDE